MILSDHNRTRLQEELLQIVGECCPAQTKEFRHDLAHNLFVVVDRFTEGHDTIHAGVSCLVQKTQGLPPKQKGVLLDKATIAIMAKIRERHKSMVAGRHNQY
jgi:hypothetical protein